MRFYYTTDFPGFWPVGAAAVVIASSEDEAHKLLKEAIEARGLTYRSIRRPDEEPELVELRGGPIAKVVLDGEY